MTATIDEPRSARTAIALTIAGSDSSGGAGIQADLKTFAALGVYGASVITALTAQNTRGVVAVHEAPAAIVASQMQAVFDDLPVAAVKIGMLASPEIIDVVADALNGRTSPVVVDPVMVAKSGDALLQDAAVATLKARLLPCATLLTPNLPEAARLLGTEPAVSVPEMEAQGRRLLELGPEAVLMKGGHRDGAEVIDLLVRRDRPILRIEAERVPTRNTHGTGCTLSSAVAAFLARGLPLEAAFEAAHAYTQGAIRSADRLAIGSGHGPLHHFHELWT